MSIRFCNIRIHDMLGGLTGTIDGDFTDDALTNRLIEEWVPYIECHRKCCSADTCSFAQPPRKDERCGLRKAIIRNYIHIAKEIISKSTDEQKEALLAGAFHLSEYAAQSTFKISLLADKDALDGWGEHSHLVITSIIKLREKLNMAGQALGKVPQIYHPKPILLVEGESEQAFLNKLKESHMTWFSDLRIEVYGGAGNTHPKRIQMRLDKYNEDGYVCYMQGDKDGVQKGKFDRLIQKKTVKPENIFEFTHDFETSIPPRLLLKVLNNLGSLEDVDPSVFSRHFDGSRSATEVLRAEYVLDIKPLKIAIADETAWIISNSDFGWYQDPNKFLEKEELGRFLDFVIKMGAS